MLMLVWLMAQATGVTNCETILAGAQTMACIPRNLQLPALISLMSQIVQSGGIVGPQGPPGPVLTFAVNCGGNLPTFIPSVLPGQMAINYDPSSGQPSWFVNGAWTF